MIMQYISYIPSFMAVYQQGSFEKASQIRGITRKTIAKHINCLENKFRTTLFIQTSSGMKPTRASSFIYKAILPSYHKIQTVLDDYALNISPEIKLITYENIYNKLIVPLYPKFEKHGIKLNFEAYYNKSITSDLLDIQENSIAILDIFINKYAVNSTKLFEEEHILVGTPKWHNKLNLDDIKKDKLGPYLEQNADWITYSEIIHPLNTYFKKCFNYHPNIEYHITVNDVRMQLNLIASGAGIGVVPKHLCLDLIEQGKIVILHHPKEKSCVKFNLIYNAHLLDIPSYKHTYNILKELTL